MSAYDNLCPACNGPMVSRKNNSTGQMFWGCKRYPECNGTRNTDGEARRVLDASESEQQAESPSERAKSNDRARWKHQE